MAKKSKTAVVNQAFLFDAKTVTREALLEQMKYWRPAGSGPLHMMKYMCGLISQVAELRGFAPFTVEEVNAPRLQQEDQ